MNGHTAFKTIQAGVFMVNIKGSLGERFPELSKEWHPDKNEGLTPFEVRPSWKKKVWWLCKVKNHPYFSSIDNRVYLERGCPYCSGQMVCEENSLASRNPSLAKQWHPEKNGDLTPFGVTFKSAKKVWWQCERNEKHVWEESVANRGGCPYCSNRRVCNDNCLATITPKVAKLWHPNKNELTPNGVFPFSTQEYWWICDKNKEHEWCESVVNLQKRDGRCPYCPSPSLKRVRINKNYSLGVLYPELAKEWHPEKNTVTAFEVAPFSNQYATWLCEFGHEWSAIIASRAKGNGCPECAKHTKTSFPEQAFYFYLKQLVPNTSNHETICGMEADICIDNQIIVEYDGYFHKDGKNRDEKKNNKWLRNNYLIYRIREFNLPKIEKEKGLTIYHVNPKDQNNLTKCIEKILREIGLLLNKSSEHIKVDLTSDDYDIRELIRANRKEKSLASKFPELAKEWHPSKNGSLQPSFVTAHCDLSVWWVCPDGHEYKASIDKRSYSGRGCPYCANKKITPEKSLAVIKPDVSKTWHPTKNGKLTPFDVFPNSSLTVWWLCNNGHSFDMRIASRKSAKYCPYCHGRRVSLDTSIAGRYPELAKEWHFAKNKEETPFNTKPFSNKKVWWLCDVCGYEWRTTPNNRSKGTGCPNC